LQTHPKRTASLFIKNNTKKPSVHIEKKPVVFFATNKILQNRNLDVKLFGSGFISWSEKSNSNITHVLLYVIVGILD